MAKLKLVQANEKVAEKVAFGYKQVKNAVVGGYKKDTKNLHPRGMGAGMPSTVRFIRWTALIALGSTFRRG